ncbi:hypothetical protein A2943_02970 [Candidatus Adlerbacteria bacterium RIFCSPLOWO2_01_FULL_51_16]|uniref:ParB-like N-terminal domain-containing protein n=1 Tax=Candidatus Adlerbacteria bacterium RIFCSPLOWO2_01_FULL_51_16 TaxID=1797243 RepID=A0A1F4XGI8_9BACT|nr:MAG: hypothetical protein A2943_02970 [Candidatus Adlerbacteria bacterium RIFCSPLOWO2_01_FULL_51_16]
MAQFINNAIFWVEVDKIQPNPFQPRKEFDEEKLKGLAGSIRQYGVLQPLVVTRKEIERPDGLAVEYELIAGERRLRASKLAGLREVPVIIRGAEEGERVKLELAIIENLQREDLNPIDRAKAFARLVSDFNFKHAQIAEKVGKSREYVSNTVRLLGLPEEMQQAVSAGKIAEGHTRPLLMLADRPQEQQVLFREIMLKKLTVRDTESIARRIAFDRVRKKEYLYAPEILAMERELTEALGTRVAIESRENGGKLSIDFYNEDDLQTLFAALSSRIAKKPQHPTPEPQPSPQLAPQKSSDLRPPDGQTFAPQVAASEEVGAATLDDRSKEEIVADENTFDPKSFSI